MDKKLHIYIADECGTPTIRWVCGDNGYKIIMPQGLADLLTQALPAYRHLGQPEGFFDDTVRAWHNFVQPGKTTCDIKESGGQWWLTVRRINDEGIHQGVKVPISRSYRWYSVIFAAGVATEQFRHTLGIDIPEKDICQTLRQAYEAALGKGAR